MVKKKGVEIDLTPSWSSLMTIQEDKLFHLAGVYDKKKPKDYDKRVETVKDILQLMKSMANKLDVVIEERKTALQAKRKPSIRRVS